MSELRPAVTTVARDGLAVKPGEDVLAVRRCWV
jgi:hypothetical protein